MHTRQKTILASAMAVIVLAVLLLFLLPPREEDDAARGREAAGETTGATVGSETASHRQGEAAVIAAPPSMGDGDAELSGLVVAGGDVVKEGASVCARCVAGACTQEPEGTWCVSSDERGAFSLARLLAGRYVLTAEAAGYRHAVDAPVNLQSLEAAQKIDDIELQLEPGGGWIRGRVVDDLGRPIPNARVHEAGNRGTDRVVGTTAQGAFELWLQGETGVHFEAPGYARGADWIAPPRDGIELVLSPGGAVRGRVVDHEGSPVEGAAVHFMHLERPHGVSRALRFSGADGTFLVEGLWLGTYQVLVGGKWFDDEVNSFVAVAGQVAGPLEIRVRRGVDVRGIVLDKQSRTPCSDAIVSLQSSDGEAGKRLAADASGRVVFEGAMPGTYEVDARCGALAAVHPLPRIVVGVDQAGEEHQWFVEGGSELVGKVMDSAGRPVEGAIVLYSAMNQSGLWSGGVPTDALGAFRIEGLPSATFRLHAQGKFRENSEPVDLHVPHGEPIQLTLPSAGVVEVTVVDSGGRPVRGAHVESEDYRSWWVGLPQTDLAGRMKIGASPGPITLQVSYPGLEAVPAAVGEKTINVQAGREVQARITLPNHGAVLAGVVVDGEGRPVIGAQLLVVPIEGNRRDAAGSDLSSGSDGRFRIEQLPPGTYELVVRAPHGGSAVVRADAPSENIRVTLSASAGIELEVSKEDGTSPSQFSVEAVGADDRRARYQGFDGSLTMRDLSAGPWQFKVEAGEFIGTVVAEAPEGDIGKVSLVLSRGGIVSGRLVDGVSGEPVGDRSVMLMSESGGGITSTWPGSYGLFELRPVRPGSYRIMTLGVKGYGSYHSDPFEVPPGGVDVGDVRLTPAAADGDE